MEKNKKEIQEELKSLAPSLAKLKKEEVLDVPENYFNQLPDQILSQIDFSKNNTFTEAIEVEKSENWLNALIGKLELFFQPKIRVGFGMVMLLLVSVYFFVEKNQIPEDNIAGLTEEEVEAYVLENIDDFEEEMLFEFAAETSDNGLQEIEIGEEELENYLEEIVDELDESELEELL